MSEARNCKFGSVYNWSRQLDKCYAMDDKLPVPNVAWLESHDHLFKFWDSLRIYSMGGWCQALQIWYTSSWQVGLLYNEWWITPLRSCLQGHLLYSGTLSLSKFGFGEANSYFVQMISQHKMGRDTLRHYPKGGMLRGFNFLQCDC